MHNNCSLMWSFITRVFGQPPPQQPVSAHSEQVSSMIDALTEGVSQRGLPTLVCRKCGLKYENTGTYLSGASCPDCSS